MKLIIKYSVYFLICVSTIFIDKTIISNIKYDLFKEFCNALMVISGMVFTIMGIWIAFLYPNALQKIKDPISIEIIDFTYGKEDTKRLEFIVGAVLKSLLIMAIVLIIYATIPIVISTEIYKTHVFEFKYLATFTSFLMLILQLECICNVVISNLLFLKDIHRVKSEIIADHDF